MARVDEMSEELKKIEELEKIIYELYHVAGTKPDPGRIKAMAQYFVRKYGEISSLDKLVETIAKELAAKRQG